MVSYNQNMNLELILKLFQCIDCKSIQSVVFKGNLEKHKELLMKNQDSKNNTYRCAESYDHRKFKKMFHLPPQHPSHISSIAVPSSGLPD